MKATLREWEDVGCHFTLDWLPRSVNTVLTGEVKFQYLDEKTADEVQEALQRATKHIDSSLNLISRQALALRVAAADPAVRKCENPLHSAERGVVVADRNVALGRVRQWVTRTDKTVKS